MTGTRTKANSFNSLDWSKTMQKNRITGIITLLTFAILFFLLAAAPRAEALKILSHSGTWKSRIMVGHSGKCLDVVVASKADGANVQQWSCHGGSNQSWEFVNTGQNYFQIKNVNSGKCLDVAVASMADGGNIHQFACHGGNNQKWALVKKSVEYYQIKPAHSGKCLDVVVASKADGANIQQWGCHGGNNQYWKISLPNFVGMALTQAQAALVALGLSPDKGVPLALSYTNIANRLDLQGQVSAQSPVAGFTGGVSSVALKVYKSGTLVPNLAYKTLAEAQAALAAVGLIASSEITYQLIISSPESASRNGQVDAQNPAANSIAAPGTSVALRLFQVMLKLPNVVSMTKTQADATFAAAKMSEMGVKVTATYPEVFNKPDLHGKVLTQTPTGGTIPYVNSVAITVGRNVNRVPRYIPEQTSQAQYLEAVKNAGLTYIVYSDQKSSSYKRQKQVVYNARPDAGSVVAPGTKIIVYSKWIFY